MKKIRLIIFTLIFLTVGSLQVSSDENFNIWLNKFKMKAIQEGISKKTVNSVMDKAIFLPKVIEYDRYQPEFYEDTKTYVSKRTSKDRVKKCIKIYKKNKSLINIVDEEFDKLFKIYPNPSDGKLFIVSSNDFSSNDLFSVKDILGKNVFETNFTNQASTQSIDLSFLEPGSYLIFYETEEFRLSRSLIIE